LHQMIASGAMVHFWDKDVKWFSLRNIDNSAATFDEDWLVALGMLLIERRDMQPEVSPRVGGQKGGGLYRFPAKGHVLNEDPAIKASLDNFEQYQKSHGFIKQDASIVIGERATQFASDHERREITVKLGKYFMRYENYSPSGEEIKEVTIDDLILLEQKGKLMVYEKDGKHFFYQTATSQDSYWFNDAVAIFTLKYAVNFYKKKGQSDEEFIEELRAATRKERRSIAERGRGKFPVLIDPKPAEKGMVTARPETNFWQGTSVVAEGIKVQAVGVNSLNNIRAEFEEADRLGDEEKKIELVRHLRMLATKRWTGPESYEGNKPYIPYILEQVLNGDLLGIESLTQDELQAFVDQISPRDVRDRRADMTSPIDEITHKVRELLQEFIENKNKALEEGEEEDKGSETTAISI